MSSTMSASELVDLLNDIVSKFDELCNYHELEKIKTIGDAYCKYDTTCILIHR
ncbi:Adenylate and Guanylate cyclase catalytic domain protein [compost metagenome]